MNRYRIPLHYIERMKDRALLHVLTRPYAGLGGELYTSGNLTLLLSSLSQLNPTDFATSVLFLAAGLLFSRSNEEDRKFFAGGAAASMLGLIALNYPALHEALQQGWASLPFGKKVALVGSLLFLTGAGIDLLDSATPRLLAKFKAAKENTTQRIKQAPQNIMEAVRTAKDFALRHTLGLPRGTLLGLGSAATKPFLFYDAYASSKPLMMAIVLTWFVGDNCMIFKQWPRRPSVRAEAAATRLARE